MPRDEIEIEEASSLERMAIDIERQELEVLGAGEGEETARIETVTFGETTQISFEAAKAYEKRARDLAAELDRRRADLRARSAVRIAGIEMIGGRLLVGTDE